MPRHAKHIIVDLLPLETVDAEHRCPWIRATEVLIRAAERLGLPLFIEDIALVTIGSTNTATTADVHTSVIA